MSVQTVTSPAISFHTVRAIVFAKVVMTSGNKLSLFLFIKSLTDSFSALFRPSKLTPFLANRSKLYVHVGAISNNLRMFKPSFTRTFQSETFLNKTFLTIFKIFVCGLTNGSTKIK
jgi:hypothetical protein